MMGGRAEQPTPIVCYGGRASEREGSESEPKAWPPLHFSLLWLRFGDWDWPASGELWPPRQRKWRDAELAADAADTGGKRKREKKRWQRVVSSSPQANWGDKRRIHRTASIARRKKGRGTRVWEEKECVCVCRRNREKQQNRERRPKLTLKERAINRRRPSRAEQLTGGE